MTDEALLQLALRSVNDPDARPVLGDIVLTSGWADARVTWLLTEPNRARRWRYDRYRSGYSPDVAPEIRSSSRARNLSRKNARNPTRRWCRAVAAVLLFGTWGTERWSLPQQALEEPFPFSILRWGEEYPAFVGVDRSADPTRLAGMMLDSQMLSPRERVIQAARMLAESSEYREINRRLQEAHQSITFDGRHGRIRVIADPQVSRHSRGVLVNLWDRERQVAYENARNIYSRYLYGTGTDNDE